MVIQLESAKAPPNLSISPFHEIKIIVGTSITMITALRLRHCVVKSAPSNEVSAAEVDGILVCMFMILFYERIARPVRPMNTSSNVIFPLRDALMTSGLVRLLSISACGVSIVITCP